METNEQQDGLLEYTHRIKPGVTPLKNYGIKLAKMNAIPKFIVQVAEELINILRSSFQV